MVRANAGTKGVPRPDREAQIVAVASEAFGADGFAGTSVAAVAGAAGISKPLVYQYFGSKEGLFLACLHEAATALAEEMERIAAGDAVGLERGLLTLDGVFGFLDTRRWLWRLLFDPSAPREGEIAAELAGHTKRIGELALEGVGELMHLAGNDDPLDVDAMARAWMSVFDSVVTWWLDHPDQSPAQMSARCVRLFQALLGSEVPASLS